MMQQDSRQTQESVLVLEVKGNSLDDGPGIRSVVFFKGCPLSCVWCHNPESKQSVPEIAFDANACVGCGACRQVCPEGALSADNPFYVNRERCTLCFLCVDACPSGALERVGNFRTVDQVLEIILPDKPFFDTSGGGVTLSGGEPTLYMDFSSKLLAELQQRGIHTLVETCGQFKRDPFMGKIYPYCDAIYFDIKLIDSDRHKKYCGLPNETILDNFTQLAKAAEANGKTLLPRIPLIPGITDSDNNLRGIANFLKQQGVKTAQLLRYNPLWHEKSDKIGVANPYKQDPAMTCFADKDVLARGRAIFTDAGIQC